MWTPASEGSSFPVVLASSISHHRLVLHQLPVLARYMNRTHNSTDCKVAIEDGRFVRNPHHEGTYNLMSRTKKGDSCIHPVDVVIQFRECGQVMIRGNSVRQLGYLWKPEKARLCKAVLDIVLADRYEHLTPSGTFHHSFDLQFEKVFLCTFVLTRPLPTTLQISHQGELRQSERCAFVHPSV